MTVSGMVHQAVLVSTDQGLTSAITFYIDIAL
jgi:hypothetical protein